MSFTGKATYAQLYPNRPSCDAGDVGGETYGQGAVLRARGGQYFLLSQLGQGMSLIILASGNRWKDGYIPTCRTRPSRCTAIQILDYLDCSPFEYVGPSRSVLAVNADEDDA